MKSKRTSNQGNSTLDSSLSVISGFSGVCGTGAGFAAARTGCGAEGSAGDFETGWTGVPIMPFSSRTVSISVLNGGCFCLFLFGDVDGILFLEVPQGGVLGFGRFFNLGLRFLHHA